MTRAMFSFITQGHYFFIASHSNRVRMLKDSMSGLGLRTFTTGSQWSLIVTPAARTEWMAFLSSSAFATI